MGDASARPVKPPSHSLSLFSQVSFFLCFSLSLSRVTRASFLPSLVCQCASLSLSQSLSCLLERSMCKLSQCQPENTQETSNCCAWWLASSPPPPYDLWVQKNHNNRSHWRVVTVISSQHFTAPLFLLHQANWKRSPQSKLLSPGVQKKAQLSIIASLLMMTIHLIHWSLSTDHCQLITVNWSLSTNDLDLLCMWSPLCPFYRKMQDATCVTWEKHANNCHWRKDPKSNDLKSSEFTFEWTGCPVKLSLPSSLSLTDI